MTNRAKIYDEAIAALQYAKENDLSILCFVDKDDEGFTTAISCSPKDLAAYLDSLLEDEDFSKVIIGLGANIILADFMAEQIAEEGVQ